MIWFKASKGLYAFKWFKIKWFEYVVGRPGQGQVYFRHTCHILYLNRPILSKQMHKQESDLIPFYFHNWIVRSP